MEKIIIKNVVAGVILLLLLNYIKNNNHGYKWMWDSLLNGNLNYINEVNRKGGVTLEQKNEIKYGFFYRYLKYIVDNTPEDAVIIMPTDSVIKSLPEKYKMGYLSNRQIVTYFLYPRRAIYENFQLDDSIMGDATYVAIAGGKGFEKVNYLVKKKSEFMVLPINKAN